MGTNKSSFPRRDFFQNLTTLGLAGLGGGVLLSACGGSSGRGGASEAAAAQETSRDQDIERLNEIRREWEQAENEGDPSIIDRHAADDIIAMPPGQPPVVGAEAGKEHLREFFDRFDVNVEYSSEEIVVSDDLAFDRLSYQEQLVPKGGGEPIEHTGSSLWIYRRTSDGWKQSHAIWNENS